MEEFFEEKIKRKMTHFSWSRVWIVITGLFLLVLFLFFLLISRATAFSDRVIPGLNIAGVPVGGMARAEVEDFLQSMNDKFLNEGLRFSFQSNNKEEKIFLSPVIVAEGAAIELMYIDVKKETERLLRYGKKDNVVENAIAIEISRFSKPSVKLENIAVDYPKMISLLEDQILEYERMPLDAGVNILSVNPLEYKITTSSPGVIFQYEEAVKKAVFAWSLLEVPDIEINQRNVEAILKEDKVNRILFRLPAVLKAGSLTLSYKDPQSKESFEWYVDTNQIGKWINVQKISDNEYGFGLDKKNVEEYIKNTIAPKVEIEAKDAKFLIDENGKVVEFQGSRPGIKLNFVGTYYAVNEAILQRTKHDEGLAKDVQLVVEKIEPNATTGEDNNLGIEEVLGAGVSYFTGSPTNRIKNIKNALNKLNGILIKPDEEFSAIKYTKPYTIEGGYLPELVIKGDEIKPEMGGGLCQIGTTLFRMAMNSGMPIIERRNHSLVVNYYNDLKNGLPGTDATIYEPSPDFRFKNDTGNYILIQTSIDEKNSKLEFTLWGTSDGRKGSYEAPVLEKWIEHGETQYIETEKLAPGEKKCQHAYRGAKTSFKYIRELATGEKKEEVFESYYRPLPEICLVGVEKKQSCFDENGSEIFNCDINPASEIGAEAPIIAE